ncbi:MAG: DUF222 domain-containing protein [Actinomycetia bacterium]|nr:DUF222 domain-containing protein [Actinomycetes bacterium]
MTDSRQNQGLPVELLDAVDAVAKALTVNYRVYDTEALRNCVSTMTGLRNRVEALDARVLDVADQPAVYAQGTTGGSATLRSYLYATSNGRRGQLAGRTLRADRLSSMPLVRDAFEAGQLTPDHIRVLGELTQPRFYQHFIDAEQTLVDWATTMAWDEFAKAIQAWRNAADDSEPDLKDEKDQQARSVHLSRGWKDRGMLDGTLTPEARVLVGGEVDRIALQLLKHDRAEAKARLGTDKITNNDLQRSAAQRRHDALVIMACRSNGADADTDMASPIAHIRASLECVQAALAKAAGLEPEPVPPELFECEFDDGTAMTYHQLVKYLVQAKVHSVVLSQNGEVLHYGTGRRWFTPKQRQAIAYRDRWCNCGCGLLARQVDTDHVLAAEDGGLTNLDNGEPRCRTTHTRKTAAENHRRAELRRQKQWAVREEREREETDSVDQRPPSEVFDRPPDETGKSRDMWCQIDPDRGPPPPTETHVQILYRHLYYPDEETF